MNNMKKTTSIAALIICMTFSSHTMAQQINGNLTVTGSDIKLGTNDGRPTGTKKAQRALVHFHNDELILNYDGDFEGGTRVQSNLTVGGFSLNHNGADFRLGLNDGRDIGEKTLQRALVHGGNDELFLNFGGDFEGATHVQSDLTVEGFLLNHHGADFRLGLNDGRDIGEKTLQRALVHGGNDELFLNFAGDFEGGVIINSKVGIGTSAPRNTLDVNGTIRSKEIKVEASPWPDYVFGNNYDLKSLNEVEGFINTNKHLPNIPSAQEIEEDGVSLGEINAKLLQKIEEITLYLIEQNKAQEELMNTVQSQQVKIEKLNKEISSLKK